MDSRKNWIFAVVVVVVSAPLIRALSFLGRRRTTRLLGGRLLKKCGVPLHIILPNGNQIVGQSFKFVFAGYLILEHLKN